MPETDLQSNALGSAAAGIFSRCLTHPLDTAKARLQALPISHGPTQSSKCRGGTSGTYSVLRTMARSEGMASWYRGFGAVLVGGTPGTILYLCSYDIIKNQLNKVLNGETTTSNNTRSSQQDSFAVYLASGMLAEAIACTIYVPVDVVKERMQVQSSSSSSIRSTNRLAYKSSWDALVTIGKQEGLSGIYKGYGATMTSFGPFSALYFVFYEDLKSRSRKYNNQSNEINSAGSKKGDDLPMPWIVGSSATAGALASFITSPLDMAKLRLQIQRGSAASMTSTSSTEAINMVRYRSMRDCLSQVFQREGIQGLFRGAGARVLHFVPATTVTMTCYESCRSFFYKRLNP
ncbi:unnamed protein product [Cylindrotheca closterium]|uniref:Mitochondrial carrier protein n=1 Tax=Cylindrotheca closterium TaxID=2856 RepID=A0AAD2FUU0_9STRA|nr:unnamed protein product [Cylindrotheca closterium]